MWATWPANSLRNFLAAEVVETKEGAGVDRKSHMPAFSKELSLEDRINDEVRVILEAYSEEMQKDRGQTTRRCSAR